MADVRPVWKPDFDCFETAQRLARLILRSNENIQGVALTGSLARKEKIHDIDLVLFHDGQAYALGTVRRPAPTLDPYKFLSLEQVLPSDEDVQAFDRIRGEIPVDLILVSSSVLWNCTYLRALKPFEVYEDFYPRVFNDQDVPLYLLAHRFTRSDIDRISDNSSFVSLAEKQGRHITGIRIWHKCGKDGCRPRTPWKECRVQVAARKVELARRYTK